MKVIREKSFGCLTFTNEVPRLSASEYRSLREKMHRALEEMEQSKGKQEGNMRARSAQAPYIDERQTSGAVDFDAAFEAYRLSCDTRAAEALLRAAAAMALGKDLWNSADDFSRMCGVQSVMAARFYALGRMLAEAEVASLSGFDDDAA